MKPFLLHGAFLVAFCICMTVARAEEGTFQLKQTISLPGVEGRIDHMALDASGERLFVCAFGNNTVEVLDLRKGGANSFDYRSRCTAGDRICPGIESFVCCE